MVDIAMCSNNGCGMKDTCYRHLAEPSDYQTFGLFCPSDDNHCEFYWKISSKDELDLLNKEWRF